MKILLGDFNRALRRIFERNRKWRETAEDCSMRSFVPFYAYETLKESNQG
jgi:hypothetical protein